MTACVAALVVVAFCDLGAVEVKDQEVYGALEYYCPPNCTVDVAIRLAAQRWGISEARLRCLARLESTFNPNAQNGRYLGLYQFDLTTWALTPHREYPRTNAWAAAQGAAYLISLGQGSRWPPLAYC